MARFAFDPSKWSRWFLPFPRPIPPVVSGAFDDPKTCVGINQRWAVKLIAAIDTLSDRRTWDGATDSEFAFIEQQVGLIQAHLLKVTGCADDCPECPEPAPCPECPDCPEQPPTDQPVGNFGYTIDELESMIMGCINISGMLKFENGFLYVKDDCCNWVKVTGQAAPVLTTQTPSGSAASTFDLWQDQGFPALPEQPAVQHSNSAYTTLDSLRCAKATALTEALWNYLNSDREILEDAAGGSSITTLIATIAGFFASLPPAELLDFATTTRTAALGMDMVDYSADLLAILDDELIKSEIICVLTDRVAAPINLGGWTMNRVTDSDIQATIQTFIDVTGAAAEIEARVNAVLLKELAWNTTQKLDTIECGCEDKLPHGYTPNPLAGFHFTHRELAAMGTGLDLISELNGTVLGTEHTFQVPNVGQVSGSMVQTAYAGISNGYPIDRFHWIIEPSEPVSLDAVKLTVAYAGTPTQFSAEVHVFDSVTGLWENFASANDGTAPIDTALVMGAAGTAHDVSRISIQMKVRAVASSNTRVLATVTAATFTGTIDGNAFIDLPINTEV